MRTVARLIVYTGTGEAVDRCLGQSLNDGRKEVEGLSIRVVTLPESFLRLLGEAARTIIAQAPEGQED